MRRLTPSLPFAPNETLHSWVARLAALHTGGPLLDFLADVGIPANAAWPFFSSDHIDLLCTAAEQAPGVVHRNNGRILTEMNYRKQRLWELRGQLFSPRFMYRLSTRFCPLCLLEDGADESLPHAHRRHRLIWTFQIVRTCPKHGLSLASNKLGRWDDRFSELRYRVPEDSAELRRQADAQTCCAISPLQDYVTRRLDGEADPAWLDDQRIDQACRATEVLGVTMMNRTQNMRTMTDGDWEEAGRVGWTFVRDGEEGVRRALEELLRTVPGGQKVKGRGKRAFGLLFNWLSGRPGQKDRGPIRDLVAEIYFENLPLMPGATLMGRTVEAPGLTTPALLATRHDLDARTIRNMLVAQGAIDATTGGRRSDEIVVASEVGEAAVEALHSDVAVRDVPALLNTSRPIVLTLIALGRLRLIAARGTANSKIARAIDKQSVEEVREFVQTLPIFDASKATGQRDYVDLELAPQRLKRRKDLILPLLFDGHTRSAARLPGHDGLGAVVIRYEELRALLGQDQEEMPRSTAFHLIDALTPGPDRERLTTYAEGGAFVDILNVLLPQTCIRTWQTNLVGPGSNLRSEPFLVRMFEMHETELNP